MERSPQLRELKSGHWQSFDDDPWFRIPGPFAPGRYRLKFIGNVDADAPATDMKLYYADADGQFGEADFIVLGRMPRAQERGKVRVSFELAEATPCLRLDPQQAAGRFQLTGLSIRRAAPSSPWLKQIKTRLGIYRLRRYLAPRRAPADLLGDTPPPAQTVADSLPNVVPLNLSVHPAAPCLNVLIPGMAMRAMSGGPNTAINLTYRMAEAGVPVRYISTCGEMDRDHAPLWDHFQSLTGIRRRLPNVEIVCAYDRRQPTVIGSDDLFFGTAWWTVQMIKHALPMMRRKTFLYIIQDFEPAFYAWSSLYALALETYDLDFRGIFCSRLLADYFNMQRVGQFADPSFMDRCCTSFEPAVDETRFFPDRAAHSCKKRLLFYARPGAPRNLFELGLVALKRAVERGAFPPDQWELLFIGQQLAPHDLGCGVVIRSHPWLDYENYGRLLRGADVGLSLMCSPHTSYPPLEMAACGVSVVTNVFSVKTADRLRSISRNILPVLPNVDAIVEGLLAAFDRADDYAGRIAWPINGVPRSWDDTFREVLPTVLRMWAECQASEPSAASVNIDQFRSMRSPMAMFSGFHGKPGF